MAFGLTGCCSHPLLLWLAAYISLNVKLLTPSYMAFLGMSNDSSRDRRLNVERVTLVPVKPAPLRDQADEIAEYWCRENPAVDPLTKTLAIRLRRAAHHLERELRRDGRPRHGVVGVRGFPQLAPKRGLLERRWCLLRKPR